MVYYNIITEASQVQCTLCEDKKYSYDLIENQTQFNIGKSPKPPLEITKQSSIGKTIFQRIKKNFETFKEELTLSQIKEFDLDKEFRLILGKLDQDVQSQLKQSIKDEKEETEKTEKKYMELHSRFQYNLTKFGLTPLEYIIYVFDALGVGASLEIMKAFCGYLQTNLGLKGTNVIGVGNQSSGKTHCVENPLDCIPDEFVHRGIYSKASFFTEFAGEDLTQHIFYMGDLGGDHDDDNTKEFRDELKKLSTDGFTSRNYKEDGEVITETITGTPCLAYTTVSEEMINEQERSRSVILMPPDVNPRRLMIYNSFIESPGGNFGLKHQIQKDKECVKGFVWWLGNQINNVEMFNPFMFCVQRYLNNMEDFNRKINEFNMLLKIICILNDSFKITHTLYYDVDTEEPIETTLYIPSKQDVIDALNLFEGSTGLLPREIALTKGLLKKYDVLPKEYAELDDTATLPDDATYEEIITYNITNYPLKCIEIDDDETNQPYLIGYADPIIDDDGKEKYCFFTIDDVRRGSTNQRWYREVSSDLSDKLRKLYSFGILIKLGKNKEGKNVYTFGEDVERRVESIEPIWSNKDVKLAMDTFKGFYPEQYPEVKEYVKTQQQVKTKFTTFEFKDNPLYNLFWNTMEVD